MDLETTSIKKLQEAMQKYEKYFSELNYVTKILESHLPIGKRLIDIVEEEKAPVIKNLVTSLESSINLYKSRAAEMAVTLTALKKVESDYRQFALREIEEGMTFEEFHEMDKHANQIAAEESRRVEHKQSTDRKDFGKERRELVIYQELALLGYNENEALDLSTIPREVVACQVIDKFANLYNLLSEGSD